MVHSVPPGRCFTLIPTLSLLLWPLLCGPQDVHIIMELCEGGELFDRIVERKYYTERQAARVIRQVVEVLEAIHSKGLVHRDLKPENTLLVSKRSDTRVKVIDFGMAIYLKPGQLPLSLSVLSSVFS